METRARSYEITSDYRLVRHAIEAFYPTVKMILRDGLCLSILLGSIQAIVIAIIANSNLRFRNKILGIKGIS
jgi:hypothetical protein